MSSLSIEAAIPVRTYDIDFAGHVSNIVYVRWLEDLRYLLFERHFSLQSLMDNGCTMVLKSTTVDYRHSIKLFDGVKAKMWVDSVSKVSITIKAEFYVGEVLTTTASHVGVFVDLEKLKPRRVPLDIIDKFNQSPLV
jgi:acyl-CoA thioester hydrolase